MSRGENLFGTDESRESESSLLSGQNYIDDDPDEISRHLILLK